MTDHLTTLRALMERTAAHRAASAPVALAAGFLTLLVAGLMLRLEGNQRLSPEGFAGVWLGVLAGFLGVGFYRHRRGAQRRGEPVFSRGMKLVLRTVAPPLLAGLALSICGAVWSNSYTDLVSFWILFYGLALLAMGPFAPRALRVLGVAFLICGVLSFLPFVRSLDGRSWQAALISLSLTFGGLHLIYAVWVFLLVRHGEDAAAS